MAVAEQFLKGENVLIVAIDNPHLCLGSRMNQMLKRLLGMLEAKRITICGNYPDDLTLDRSGLKMIPIRHLGQVEDESEFVKSFEELESVPLLRGIKMPISGLDLYDVAGFDGLIYPYRVSCELDWSGLDELEGPCDLIIILGGSHFNYPLPERVLAAIRTRGHSNGQTRMVGVPIGPVTGPLSPHWCDSCDVVLVANEQVLEVLRKINLDFRGEVAAELFDGIPEPMTLQTRDKGGRINLLIDWTFIHNWQLKAVLRELARSDLRHKINLSLTAVSEETTQMLWAKWGVILEELEPQWVYISGDEYYRAVSGMDLVIGFVCGRDVWVWRGDRGGVLICDFAGWWRAFGFEGPSPVASPKRLMSKLEQMVSLASGSS